MAKMTYGAPMGRPDSHPGNEPIGNVTLQRIPLQGDYDRGGAYWGSGAPLFWAGDESGDVSIYFRAASRAAAELHVINLWPGATFNR